VSDGHAGTQILSSHYDTTPADLEAASRVHPRVVSHPELLVPKGYQHERSRPLLASGLDNAPRDVRWVTKRMRLNRASVPLTFLRSSLSDLLEGALLESGFVQEASDRDAHRAKPSRVTSDLCQHIADTFEVEGDDGGPILSHRLRWPDGEFFTIDIHPDWYHLDWSTSKSVAEIGMLFSEDLGRLTSEESEAAVAFDDARYHIEASELAPFLHENDGGVDWFRVNLANESFTFLRPATANAFSEFSLTSDIYDSRLIFALVRKTGTLLARGSARTILRYFSDIYRAPGIGLRVPSMLKRFLAADENH